VSPKIKDRHLFGAGAAACAVCCAPPLLALLGIAGAGLAATIATVAFAGLAFGIVVLAGSLLALWARRRASADACAADGPVEGPVDVTIGARPTDAPQEPDGSR
jgi:ethanolamine utilization microcompartment shell protein EutL